MRMRSTVLVLLAATAPALAQQTPDPWLSPPGSSYAPAPPPLTEEERELLARGEISPGQILAGGACAWLLGFGIGQAVEGRWKDKGWIFTAGEVGSLVAIVGSVNPCIDHERCGYLGVSVIALLAFRVWELVDVFVGPGAHNRRVRELRARQGQGGPPPASWSGFVVPSARGEGALAGVTVTF